MNIATLKMDTENWDMVQLVIKDDVAQIIKLKNRDSAVELNHALNVAYFKDHSGHLTVSIDDVEYRFTQRIWHALLSVTDQWMEEYVPSTHPELFDTRETAEVIPLFG